MTVVSFRLNYLLHGLHPFGFHLANLVLHLLVTLLYTRFVSQVLNHRRRITLITSFLFASHPVHVESVTSIVGRADVGAALFYILALMSYAHFVRLSRHANRFLYASLGLAALSMLSKEHGVTCLAVCIVYHLFIIHRFFPFSKKSYFKLLREVSIRGIFRILTPLPPSTVSLLSTAKRTFLSDCHPAGADPAPHSGHGLQAILCSSGQSCQRQSLCDSAILDLPLPASVQLVASHPSPLAQL